MAAAFLTCHVSVSTLTPAFGPTWTVSPDPTFTMPDLTRPPEPPPSPEPESGPVVVSVLPHPLKRRPPAPISNRAVNCDLHLILPSSVQNKAVCRQPFEISLAKEPTVG